MRRLPLTVFGLVEQSSLEDTGALNIAQGSDSAGLTDVAVSLTYTLWRNPGDRSDPANLADLDDETRAALDREPPYPRPQWLVDRVQQLRYPQLWEAVRTTWTRDPGQDDDPAQVLTEHLEDVLTNRYAEERGAELIGQHTTVEVDDATVDAVEINTHPLLYAVGARVAADTVVTAVLPRSELPCVDVAFATRRAPGADG
ncbi:hypothetical protein EFY87_11225 [Flexivirga caeni]|uniref:Uncharacterized protein n=1 Tax=Flexivirga caeni TaxID=2294115 RepID=A0A3M9M838_9MICO|nr:hypothetical protein EFY87_11225 [Flexivirga caeni]